MRKIAYYLAVVLFIMLIPVSRVAADTEEEATQENPQELSTEEPMEEPIFESSTEEYTDEYYEEWTDETYDYVPPQTEETYEEWTEESYEDSYEPEPTVEQTVEPTVEEFTQEIIEEPVEAPTEEPAAEMEPVNVDINQSEVTEFSIEGKVMADAKGVADVRVSLSGEKEDEAVTDAEGKFQFQEVPAGDYTLEIDVPEGYEADETNRTLTVDDKGKKGIIFDLSKKDEPQEEGLEPEEQISAGENLEEPGMNTMLVIIGSVLLILGLLVYAIRLVRNK